MKSICKTFLGMSVTFRDEFNDGSDAIVAIL